MKVLRTFCFLSLCSICMLLTSCNEEVTYVPNQTFPNQYTNEIIVDLKGAVCFPGLYSVRENSLLIDVIKLAGGLIDGADEEKINFAMTLTNNQMIIIPSKHVSETNDNDIGLININTGTISDLSTLPGIGTAKARNIIDYRSDCGMFTSIDQLKNVSGISESIFEKIKSMVTL